MAEETQDKPLDELLNEEEPVAEPVEEPIEEVDWKSEAEKARKLADDYKKEIEVKGLRKKRVEEAVAPTDLNQDQVILIQNDFLSKKEDVLHEVQSEIDQLGEEEWSKIQPLFKGAINSVFDTAVSQKRYVAKGEIVQSLKTLIDFAKTGRDKKNEVERARIDGFKQAQNLENAEISGTRNSTRTQTTRIQVTDADKQAAEASKETGLRPLTPEQVALNRERSTAIKSDWRTLYQDKK